MRLFLLIVVSFVILLTIFRRLVEPFLEGYRGIRKQYNTPGPNKRKAQEFSSPPASGNLDKANAEDAEFKEID
jgi:hypothetical protein